MTTFWLIVIILIALFLVGCTIWNIVAILHAPSGREIPGVGFVADKKVTK